MKVHETRSHARTSGEEEKGMTRKQKAESNEHDAVQSPKKPKSTENDNVDQPNGKYAADIAAEFEEFSKAIREHLSIQQMRDILEANGQDTSGPDTSILLKWFVSLPLPHTHPKA
jgi:poly [ADP-ribose] polymerase